MVIIVLVYGLDIISQITNPRVSDFRNVAIDDKLRHVDHMQGIWKDVGVLYRLLKSNPPANAVELCSCINNYMREEIHQELINILKTLKDPTSNIAGFKF